MVTAPESAEIGKAEHGYRPITVEAVTLFKKDMPRSRRVETAQSGAAEALYGLGGGRRSAGASRN